MERKLLILLILLCRYQVVFTGGNALLEVNSADKLEMFCINYNDQYQHLPNSALQAPYQDLINLSNFEGCTTKDFPSGQKLAEKAVALLRGNCSFIQKAVMVERLQGSSALIVDFLNSTNTPIPGGNDSEYKSLNITVATISGKDFKTISLRPQPVKVRLFAPVQPTWDYNMIVIVIMSTVFVMLGGGWAAVSEINLLNRQRLRIANSNASNDNILPSKSPEQQFTVWMVAIWFILICTIIILLYFFYDWMVYFFIAVFCLAGSYSLYQCLLPFWSIVVPLPYDIPLNRFPCIKTKVKVKSFLLYMPCLTLGIFWAIQRHATYAWVLQDILGASFCIFFIQNLRLPNLKVIAVFLVLLLIYDVFFVFITPLFTKDGESVMESVATGGKGGSKELLPMMFLIPIMGNNPLLKCRERSYSLLGFGDVIIPGILIAYNSVYDARTGTRMMYYLASSLGYLFGMIICMVSLVYMNSGQPALLYLVPSTLLTTIGLALYRKELKRLFLGNHTEQQGVVETPAKDVEEGDINNDCLDEEQQNLIN